MPFRVFAFVCVGSMWVAYANFANDSVKVPLNSPDSQNDNSRRTANNRPSFDKDAGVFASKKSLNDDHPLLKALRHAYDAREAMQEIDDYEAHFSKRVNIRGKMIAESMHLKVREKPFSVYLKYAQPNQGREVLFIEGKNGNKILAHESGLKGLAGTIELAPDSKLAMENNVWPITEIGMTKLLNQVTKDWETLVEEANPRVRFFPSARLGETACFAIEVTNPAAVDGIRYHMWRLYVEKNDKLPVHIELYGFPRRNGDQPELLEEYTYSQVRTNVGLTDHDFSTENAAYRF